MTMTLKDKLEMIDEKIKKLKSFNSPNFGLIKELEDAKVTLQKNYEDSEEFKAEQDAKEFLDSLFTDKESDSLLTDKESDSLLTDKESDSLLTSVIDDIKKHKQKLQDYYKKLDKLDKLDKLSTDKESNSLLASVIDDLKKHKQKLQDYSKKLDKVDNLSTLKSNIQKSNYYKHFSELESSINNKLGKLFDKYKYKDKDVEYNDETKDYLSENELRILEENFGKIYITESSIGEFGIIIPSYNEETEFVFDENKNLIEINIVVINSNDTDEYKDDSFFELAYEINPNIHKIDIEQFVIHFEQITENFEAQIEIKASQFK